MDSDVPVSRKKFDSYNTAVGSVFGLLFLSILCFGLGVWVDLRWVWTAIVLIGGAGVMTAYAAWQDDKTDNAIKYAKELAEIEYHRTRGHSSSGEYMSR